MNATYKKLKLIADNPVPKYRSFLWEATFEDGQILNFINSGQCIPDIKNRKHSLKFIYSRARKDCLHKTVLDCACGSGCGSSFISKKCRHIVGVELKEDIAAYGQKRYGNDKCVIQQGDIQNLQYENEFDTVLCVDTIEHVHDTKRALENLYRAVKDSGVIIISTPEIGETQSSNPYHVKEWSRSEFKKNILWMGKIEIIKPRGRTLIARIEVDKRKRSQK